MARLSLGSWLKLGQDEYADRSLATDPSEVRTDDLGYYMQMYPHWASLYDGSALQERVSSVDEEGEEEYRWPVRFNLIRSYCHLYAALLWGRGTTGAEANSLFDVRVNPRIPGQKPATAQARQLQELLNYFWSYWFHILRASGVTQQWAGGCALKVAWDPASPNSVFGLQLQAVQPEHFWPMCNPLNANELLAVRVRFSVSREIAEKQYGLTPRELEGRSERGKIAVEEMWDRHRFYIRLGKDHNNLDKDGVVARIKDADGKPQFMDGPNPYRHPVTGTGVIPFVYIPRLRSRRFFGESLVPDLEGLQAELNKDLADIGDAMALGSHPTVGISNYNGPDRNRDVIVVPTGGVFNMGGSAFSGGPAPELHEFPLPQVPPQAQQFVDLLLGLTEVSSGLTPAARGVGQGVKSGYALALEMLPTTTVLDWQRAMWAVGVAGPGGLNQVAASIWHSKEADLFPDFLGLKINPGALRLRQEVSFRPVIPRDRTEIVDEVTRLAVADAISPREWLRRLGDIEDIDRELMELATWIAWRGEIEAAVAGRALKVGDPENKESPRSALPEVAGQTAEPGPKQQAKEPEGLAGQRDKT